MKKNFAVMLLAVGMIFCSQFANISFVQAQQVQIYDQNFYDVLNSLKKDCSKYGLNLWGTETYTYEGVKRYEIHFGDTDNNLIRFRLNNDNSVARVLVTIPNSITMRDGSEESFNQATFITGSIFKAIGMSESETRDIGERFVRKFKAFGQSRNANYFHEKFSVWCSRSNRNIIEDVEFTSSKFDWYIYAEI